MKYVVYEQIIETGRVVSVTGPFSTYDLANAYANHMAEAIDHKIYWGIRELSKTVAMRMSA